MIPEHIIQLSITRFTNTIKRNKDIEKAWAIHGLSQNFGAKNCRNLSQEYLSLFESLYNFLKPRPFKFFQITEAWHFHTFNQSQYKAVVKGGAVVAWAFPVYYYQYPWTWQQLCILQCIATSLFFGTKDFFDRFWGGLYQPPQMLESL